MLHGRDSERAVLDRLLADARDGRAGAVVVRGEAGVGKTALLESVAAAQEPQPRVLRATGIESESGLAYAGLQLLTRPVADRLDRIPLAHAAALRGVLGFDTVTAADRFLIGLSTLSLLAELSTEGPLLCLIDDVQWLDRETCDALLFAARRLYAEPIAVVFAARDEEPGFHAPGLPELRLSGLDRDTAERLLSEQDPAMALSVRDRVIAESAGNPLALIELPRALSPEQRAGAFPPLAFTWGVARTSSSSRVLGVYRAEIETLPSPSRTCLLLAALDGTGDVDVVARAAELLGADMTSLDAAERAGLVRVGPDRVAFRHPLVRPATQLAADIAQRVAAHRALARVVDPERRVWHLAAATTGHNEDVAAELDDTARRATHRGAPAAASVAAERAAELSPDAAHRGRRLTTAAQAAVAAGQLRRAEELARRAGSDATGPASAARLARVRAELEYELGLPENAARILIEQAVPLITDDPSTLLAVLSTANTYAWYSGDGPGRAEMFAATEAAAKRLPAERRDLAGLGHGLRLATEGHIGEALDLVNTYIAAAERETARSAGPQAPPSFDLTLAATLAHFLSGAPRDAHRMADDLVARCRSGGRIGVLPQALGVLAIAEMFDGRHRDALAHAAEATRLATDTGQPNQLGYLHGVQCWLTAIAGDADVARSLGAESIASSGDGRRMTNLAWASHGLIALDIATGGYEQVLQRLERESAGPARHSITMRYYAAPDHVEAAVRTGRAELAKEPLARFTDWANANRQPWARAVALRCAALTATTDAAADALYRQALEAHAQAVGMPLEQARTALLYGEWLRRRQRRADARTQLAAALDGFDRLGAPRWSARAAAELRAAGAASSGATRHTDPLAVLTPQEHQVVRLAATGSSNLDIAAQLFLSPRTVAYHLYKAFPKLKVSSRAELARFVPDADSGIT